MRVFEARFDATINRGNYESEKIGMSAQVEEGEDPLQVREILRELCYGRPTTAAQAPKKEEPKSKAEPKPKVEPKVDPAPKFEDPTPEKQEEVITPEIVKEKKETKQKTRAVLKASPYDRGNELHKKFFGEFLDKEFPTWRQSTGRAKDASIELNGTDFLDNEGQLVESFKKQLREYMS